MNRKVKIALNVTTLVLDVAGSYLREKRHAELEARVAALEEQLDNHKANHAPKTSMDAARPYISGLRFDSPYGRP